MQLTYSANSIKLSQRDYYHSRYDYIGPFVYRNNQLSYIITSEGRAIFENNTLNHFEYHIKDHLGNVRVVYQKLKSGNNYYANVVQKNDYYPFGMLMGSTYQANTTSKNKYLYNGKELIWEYYIELNWYDYGARMYDPQVGRWHVVDPMVENFYEWSPYTYCYNNPLLVVDPDGRNGIATGSGTKDDPYVITANYYYYNLNKDQVNALNAALAEYNNGGQAFEIKTENGTVYVSFNLNAIETVDADAATAAARGDFVEMDDGSRQQFGNTVTIGDVADNANGQTFGNANNVEITLDENSIQQALISKPGTVTAAQLRQGTFVHEIGHNLAGNHGDPGNIMAPISASEIRKENCAVGDCGTGRYYYNVPSVNKNGVRAIAGRIGMPYGSVNSTYLKAKENNRVAREGVETVGRILKRP